MKLEVISLIFRSTKFLKFTENQMLKYCKNFDDIEVSHRIIANDATKNVLEAATDCSIPVWEFNNTNPNEYYINRVYRAYNYGIKTSEADLVCIVNSDNGYHEDWLLPLVEWHKKGYLPASRLIESGKMPSGTNGITKYFGSSTENYDEEGFKAWAKSYMSPGILKGGLYMPALFDKNEFLAAGMYPEGNIYNNGIGTCNGRVVIAGDAWFFKKFEKKTGRQHVTPSNSLVYHIQEGEKDE
jgi:hypothetical protein